jgi:lysine 2,3-aminomutase
MFQCDPSEGTDHLRTSLEESEAIQRELWGRLSGLAMPNFSVDIPSGGGKAALVPSFEISRNAHGRVYRGWDGVTEEYRNPEQTTVALPSDVQEYLSEWESLKEAKASSPVLKPDPDAQISPQTF